jgi:hypothetical protein
VAYHRNSICIVATRLFRSEHKSKIPANRQLDSHADRYRRHTRHITAAWGYTFVEPKQGLTIPPVSQNEAAFPNALTVGFAC